RLPLRTISGDRRGDAAKPAQRRRGHPLRPEPARGQRHPGAHGASDARNVVAVTNQRSAAGARLDGVERIAILRAGGLGDTIFLLPALDALRAAYPAAEFTLLGGGIQASLFQARPPIDRVIELPPIAGVTAPHDA